VAIAAPRDALTAIGTLALAIVTAAAVIVTLVLTYQDRGRAERRSREERAHDRQLEQDYQASELYVTRAVARARITTTKRTAMATIVNGGDCTITHLVIRFSVSGHLSDPMRAVHVSAAELSGCRAPADALGDTGTLTPGRGLRVTSALVEAADAEAAVPVVRWNDRWVQRWEYRQGVPRRIKPSEPWNP
jgi:hypothetical protein